MSDNGSKVKPSSAPLRVPDALLRHGAAFKLEPKTVTKAAPPRSFPLPQSMRRPGGQAPSVADSARPGLLHGEALDAASANPNESSPPRDVPRQSMGDFLRRRAALMRDSSPEERELSSKLTWADTAIEPLRRDLTRGSRREKLQNRNSLETALTNRMEFVVSGREMVARRLAVDPDSPESILQADLAKFQPVESFHDLTFLMLRSTMTLEGVAISLRNVSSGGEEYYVMLDERNSWRDVLTLQMRRAELALQNQDLLSGATRATVSALRRRFKEIEYENFPKYDVEISDRFEGLVKIVISARNEEEALEEAEIAAAEHGCRDVTDIDVIVRDGGDQVDPASRPRAG